MVFFLDFQFEKKSVLDLGQKLLFAHRILTKGTSHFSQK